MSTYMPQRGEHKVREDTVISNGEVHRFVTVKTPITTIPFVKTMNLIMQDYYRKAGKIILIFCISSL